MKEQAATPKAIQLYGYFLVTSIIMHACSGRCFLGKLQTPASTYVIYKPWLWDVFCAYTNWGWGPYMHGIRRVTVVHMIYTMAMTCNAQATHKRGKCCVNCKTTVRWYIIYIYITCPQVYMPNKPQGGNFDLPLHHGIYNNTIPCGYNEFSIIACTSNSSMD